MIKATISSKGQIAIPKAIRDQLHLDAGTQLILDVHGESLVMRRIASDLPDWRTLRGMLRGGDLLQDLADERAAERARDEARVSP